MCGRTGRVGVGGVWEGQRGRMREEMWGSRESVGVGVAVCGGGGESGWEAGM